jgi:hypothetical protein
MDLEAFALRFTNLIGSFPNQLKVLLLRILDMPDEDRAAAIGQMFRDGTLLSVAELLMDLEENPSLRKVVAAELRDQLRPPES